MNRKLVIDKCDDCPFFDNVYWGYEETCRLLNRKIQQVDDSDSILWLKYPIPNDCPLEISDEEPTKTNSKNQKDNNNVSNN